MQSVLFRRAEHHPSHERAPPSAQSATFSFALAWAERLLGSRYGLIPRAEESVDVFDLCHPAEACLMRGGGAMKTSAGEVRSWETAASGEGGGALPMGGEEARAMAAGGGEDSRESRGFRARGVGVIVGRS